MPEPELHHPTTEPLDEGHSKLNEINSMFDQVGSIHPAAEVVQPDNEQVQTIHPSIIDHEAKRSLADTPAKFHSENLNPLDSQAESYQEIPRSTPDQPNKLIQLVDRLGREIQTQLNDFSLDAGLYGGYPVSIFQKKKNQQLKETAAIQGKTLSFPTNQEEKEDIAA